MEASGANAVRKRHPSQALIESAGALVYDEHPQIEATAPTRREVIGAMHEQAAADAAAPAARIDIEGVDLGIEFDVGIARPAAEGEAADGVVFDGDKDGTVGRAVIQPDPRLVFPSTRDREGLERARGNDAGIGRLPRAGMNRRDAIEVLRARPANHAAFRMRKA